MKRLKVWLLIAGALVVGILAIVYLSMRSCVTPERVAQAILAGRQDRLKWMHRVRPGLVNFQLQGGSTPLHTAVGRGDAELAGQLIQWGANINAPNGKGAAPLHSAAERGNLALLDLLVTHGADLNRQDETGSTPLHLALTADRKEVMSALLKAGADVNAKDGKGRTPLHLAAQLGREEMALSLLDKGADPDILDESGESSLWCAVSADRAEMVSLLLEKGADAGLKDAQGRTLLQATVQGQQWVLVPHFMDSPGKPPGRQERMDKLWIAYVRSVVDKPPSHPRRVMLVFPLVEAGSATGETAYDRGLIAILSMWRSSFVPERLLDTWDYNVHEYYGRSQMLGAGGTVTEDKIESICACVDTRNYITGTLDLGEHGYVAELTLRGENGEQKKRHEGKKEDLHKLPCLIAQNAVEYLKVPVSPRQRQALQTPLLSSAEDLPDVAEHYAAIACFWAEHDSYWWGLLNASQPGTDYSFIHSHAGAKAYKVWEHGGTKIKRSGCVAHDFLRAQTAFNIAKGHRATFDLAGGYAAPLLETDPYAAEAVGYVARSLSMVGEQELADRVIERYHELLFKDSYLAGLHRGTLMVDYAWDARGSGWAYTVKQDGWKLFGERLRQARRDLEGVVRTAPRCWPASTYLIAVAMGSGLPREYAEARLRDTVSACPGEYVAYRALMDYYQPKWHGSSEDVLELGRRAARTGLFRARLPWLLAHAHLSLRQYMPRDNRIALSIEYFSKEEVWDEIQPVLDRYLKENPLDNWGSSYYLLIATWRNDRALATRILDVMGPSLSQHKGALTNDTFQGIRVWAEKELPPLLHAVRDGQVDRIKELLAAGEDVNQQDEEGWTALFTAASYADDMTVAALLEANAKVDVPDSRRGQTPLHRAAWEGNCKIIGMLLDKGADINARARDGSTPLMEAASNTQTDAARLLTSRGADVHAADQQGATALHYAARYGLSGCVRALLAAGAYPTAGDRAGKTPGDWAAERGYDDVVMLLEQVQRRKR